MSSRPELKLDWCSYEAAKYAVEHWHYSGCVPNQKTVRVGTWEDGKFIGCVIFGDGANPSMLGPYGIGKFDGCELVRIALKRDHKTPVSRIVSIALKMLKKVAPGVRLVVSFADTDQGHHGGIYQAGGWVYAGMTEPADEYIVNGKRMHGRALRSTRSTHPRGSLAAKNTMEWARIVLDQNIKQVNGSSKHRYLMPLDEEMRQRVLLLAKPYPKRKPAPEALPVDAPCTPAGKEGGSIPTSALQGLATAKLSKVD